MGINRVQRHQWKPIKNGKAIGMTPDAHIKSQQNLPMMQTTDLSLKLDPSYGPISRHFHNNPNEFADAFARAWFKLTHRDMGPKACYLGPEVPKEELIWQDPIRKPKYRLKKKDIKYLKSKLLNSGLSISELIPAWHPLQLIGVQIKEVEQMEQELCFHLKRIGK